MDKEKLIKWFEYDYLPRIGAYRKDCKQGCDACMPMHDGDDYCDIDMLCKILALLKEQEAKKVIKSTNMYTGLPITHCPKCGVSIDRYLYGRQHEGQINYCPICGQAVKRE